ncbi:Protein of unknown function [Lactobacillus delbrueckii subsp. lactis]|nr:Protein of unknown function [Lactobacillus delbrueckii subsp. lactis]
MKIGTKIKQQRKRRA